jgi:hypothetical protein
MWARFDPESASVWMQPCQNSAKALRADFGWVVTVFTGFGTGLKLTKRELNV